MSDASGSSKYWSWYVEEIEKEKLGVRGFIRLTANKSNITVPNDVTELCILYFLLFEKFNTRPISKTNTTTKVRGCSVRGVIPLIDGKHHWTFKLIETGNGKVNLGIQDQHYFTRIFCARFHCQKKLYFNHGELTAKYIALVDITHPDIIWNKIKKYGACVKAGDTIDMYLDLTKDNGILSFAVNSIHRGIARCGFISDGHIPYKMHLELGSNSSMELLFYDKLNVLPDECYSMKYPETDCVGMLPDI